MSGCQDLLFLGLDHDPGGSQPHISIVEAGDLGAVSVITLGLERLITIARKQHWDLSWLLPMLHVETLSSLLMKHRLSHCAAEIRASFEVVIALVLSEFHWSEFKDLEKNCLPFEVRSRYFSCYVMGLFDRDHVVYSPTGKVLWVFVPGKLPARFKTPLKLSVVNLNCDDIFIMFKASTHQGADWFIGWTFV